MITTPVTAARPAFGPGATAPERAGSYAAASADAAARAALRDDLRAGAANEAKTQAAAAHLAAQRAAQEHTVPDPTRTLSTVAVAGAMSTLPAALEMMRRIALASASGTLSEADRRTLQDDYARLSQQVVTMVGSVSAETQAQANMRNDAQQAEAYRMYRESSDDQRSTHTRTVAQPVETVQQQPVTHTVTTQHQELVVDGAARRHAPVQSFRTEELHVGTDSYEPVSTRQRLTLETTQPAMLGHYEDRSQTRSVSAIEAAQVTRFVEVAQTQSVPPVDAVA